MADSVASRHARARDEVTADIGDTLPIVRDRNE